MRTDKTYNLILAAMFTAVTAVLAGLSITIPVTPVPISLATFGVMLAGGVLGSKYGSLSMLVYVLLGGFGMPIFSGYTGGMAKLTGPTGGYIVGYIACAFVVGIFVEYAEKHSLKFGFIFTILGSILGTLSCYTLGTLYFMFQTRNSLIASLGMCVLPFLIGDSIKIVVSSILVFKLRPVKSIFIQKTVFN
ncbi:MAG: biotin transporter BioY [Eubacteriales bacterium]